MRRLSLLARVAAAAVLFSAAVPCRADLVLARVNGHPVTLADVKSDFERQHEGHMSLLGEEKAVRDVLSASIERRLFVEEARRLGLQNEPKVREVTRRALRREMARWLFQKEVENDVSLSPNRVKQALEQMRRARDVILIQVDTRDEADEVRGALLEGAEPETVARARSTDRSSVRGGVVRLFWGDRPEAFWRAVWETPEGGVSTPVPVEDGWLVAKVGKEVAVNPGDPDRARARAREILRVRIRDELRDRYLASLRKRYRARIREDLLEPETLVPWVRRDAKGSDRPVAEYEGGRILLSEFASGIRREHFLSLRPGQQRLQAEHLLSDRLDEILVGLEGERRFPEAPPEVRARVAGAEEELLYRLLLGRYVFKDLDPTDRDLRKWYDSHGADFTTPVRVRLAVALLPSEGDARAFLAELDGGSSFEELTRSRSLDEATAKRGGVAGWVSPEQAIPELREGPFELGVGETGGPIRIEKGWLVYRVLDRREAELLPFEKVREKVRAAVIENLRAMRMKQWGEKLWAQSRVELKNGAIRRAGRRLAREQRERFHRREAASPPAGSAHAGAHR